MANTVSMKARRGMSSVLLGGLVAAVTALGTLSMLPGPAEAAQRQIRTTADLNVRTCASTSCAIIGVLPHGACVMARGWAAGRSWVRIDYRGRQGFVSASYVRRGCY